MIEEGDDEWLEEEKEPESLRRKWEQEASSPAGGRACPHCSQPVAADSFFCFYCGERVLEEAGPISRLAKSLRDGRFLFLILVLVIAAYLIFF